MRRSTLVALVLPLAAGCIPVTHPRYAPDLERRWVDCERLVVIPGTVRTDAKNYRTDDYFVEDAVGKRFGQLFAQGVGRVLRDDAEREPRPASEAAAVLGGDEELTRRLADRMLAAAREMMARDPGYIQEQLSGLDNDPHLVPEELRRSFDAVVVVGGRTKFETPEERVVRYSNIALRNAVAIPFILISPFFPPLGPVTLAGIASGFTGYWADAPNASYFSLAVYDGQTGRLIYANDWFDTEKVTEPEGYVNVARRLIRPLARVRGSDTAPLGERPDRWEP
jgi:hypothetical protein